MTVVLASVAFWAPITYRLIGDDGKPEVIEGRARYKRLKTSERRALDARLLASGISDTTRAELRERLADPGAKLSARVRQTMQDNLDADPIDDTEFLATVLVDWDLRDKTGNAIMHSPATLAALCEDWDGFEAALVRGYFDAQKAAQQPEEQEKNSAAPSGTGS